MSERPYCRVYWSVMDDPKFDGIRDDMKLMGAWTVLLLAADMAYPVPAYIPPTVPRASFRRLVEAGLVDELPAHRYRIHGLESERSMRSDNARNAAALRWQKSGNAETMPSRAEHSQDEQSRDETPRDPADIYWQLTGKFPKDGALSWIDGLTSTFGAEAVIAAIVKAHIADKDAATLLGRAQDNLRADSRKLDVREREAETQRLAEKRAAPRVEEPWKAEYREAIRRQYAQLEEAS